MKKKLELPNRLDYPKNIDEFKRVIEENILHRFNQVTKNSEEDKAEYAISTIFRESKGRLLIFADSLKRNGLRSKYYVENLINYIISDVGNSIDLIIEKNSSDSETLNLLKLLKNKDEFSNRISLSVLPEGYKQELTKQGKKFHFTTCVDSNLYRFEYDIMKKKAYVNFNDPEYPLILDKLFKKYKKDSIELDLSDDINEISYLLKNEVENYIN